MRLASSLIAPVLALTLLGSSNAALAAGHGSMSTCAMFTSADASKVLGGTATKTMSHTVGLFTSCDYATPKPYRLIITQAATTTAIARKHHGATATSVFTQTRKGTPGKTQTVKNLGNEAFFVPGIGQLWVLQNDVVFNLTGQSGGVPMSESQLVKAARLVIKHFNPKRK
jgi:hypothetical protein